MEQLLKIFLEPVKPKCTYTIELDDDLKTLNDILINLFMYGAKNMFGEHINPGNITKEQFDKVNEYMESVGYTTHFDFEYNEDEIPISLKIWFEKIILEEVN